MDTTFKRIIRKIFDPLGFAGDIPAIRVISDRSKGMAHTPLITNLSAPVGGTEVSHAFAANTQRFEVKARSSLATEIQFAFVSGESSTLFFTIVAGELHSEADLDLTGVTIFLQTDKNNQIIEIKEWAK